MDKDFSSFRKSTFGGFNRKDVINYIEKMRNESFEYKKQVEETVKSLNEKIRELEAAGLIMQQTAEEKEADVQQAAMLDCADIGQATKHLKVVADELCRSLGDFMDKLSEKGLFEAEEKLPEAEAQEEAVSEEVLDFVDGILASISYLGGEYSTEKEAAPKTQAKNITSVSDILSGYSFLK